MKLWYCGQLKSNEMVDSLYCNWEFQGVFSTKEKAIEACIAPGWFWQGPVELDVALPSETIPADEFGWPHGDILPENGG